MLTEELKTFINKMRTAGKNDTEIASELKNAGWDEAAISRELLSKTSKKRLNLGKVKFWITLYGITILLLILEFIFGPTLNNWRLTSWFFNIFSAIFLSFLVVVLPLFTFLSIGFGVLFWILKRIPRFKNWSPERRINYRWTFVVSSFVGGAIMLLVGIIGAGQPNIEMGGLVMLIIGMLGLAWIILALILALALIIVKIISKRKEKLSNRS